MTAYDSLNTVGHHMRLLLISLALAVGGCAQAPENEVEADATANMLEQAASQPAPASEPGDAIDVPSDPGVGYRLLDVSPGKNGNLIAISRRVGKSGVSYARREIDCAAMTFRYLGEGDTLEQAKADSSNPGDMGMLTDGSISDVISGYACQRAK